MKDCSRDISPVDDKSAESIFGEVSKRSDVDIITHRDITDAVREAKVSLLLYLMGIAQSTNGMEIWRALLSEMLHNIKERK